MREKMMYKICAVAGGALKSCLGSADSLPVDIDTVLTRLKFLRTVIIHCISCALGVRS